MATLTITMPRTGRSYKIIIDADELDRLSLMTWRVTTGAGGIPYIYTKTPKHAYCPIGWVVLGLEPDGREIDHINRNTLDNRANNLRVVTHVENMKNRIVTKRKKTPFIYPGVSRMPDRYACRKMYEARLTINGKSVLRKKFVSEAEAIAARKEAEILAGMEWERSASSMYLK